MGAGGPQAPMTLEQKKKLLWGKKPVPEEPAPSTGFGANRWDTAEFSNAGDRNKFIKLMVMAPVPSIPLIFRHATTPRRHCSKCDRLLSCACCFCIRHLSGCMEATADR